MADKTIEQLLGGLQETARRWENALPEGWQQVEPEKHNGVDAFDREEELEIATEVRVAISEINAQIAQLQAQAGVTESGDFAQEIASLNMIKSELTAMLNSVGTHATLASVLAQINNIKSAADTAINDAKDNAEGAINEWHGEVAVAYAEREAEALAYYRDSLAAYGYSPEVAEQTFAVHEQAFGLEKINKYRKEYGEGFNAYSAVGADQISENPQYAANVDRLDREDPAVVKVAKKQAEDDLDAFLAKNPSLKNDPNFQKLLMYHNGILPDSVIDAYRNGQTPSEQEILGQLDAQRKTAFERMVKESERLGLPAPTYEEFIASEAASSSDLDKGREETLGKLKALHEETGLTGQALLNHLYENDPKLARDVVNANVMDVLVADNGAKIMMDHYLEPAKEYSKNLDSRLEEIGQYEGLSLTRSNTLVTNAVLSSALDVARKSDNIDQVKALNSPALRMYLMTNAGRIKNTETMLDALGEFEAKSAADSNFAKYGKTTSEWRAMTSQEQVEHRANLELGRAFAVYDERSSFAADIEALRNDRPELAAAYDRIRSDGLNIHTPAMDAAISAYNNNAIDVDQLQSRLAAEVESSVAMANHAKLEAIQTLRMNPNYKEHIDHYLQSLDPPIDGGRLSARNMTDLVRVDLQTLPNKQAYDEAQMRATIARLDGKEPDIADREILARGALAGAIEGGAAMVSAFSMLSTLKKEGGTFDREYYKQDPSRIMAVLDETKTLNESSYSYEYCRQFSENITPEEFDRILTLSDKGDEESISQAQAIMGGVMLRADVKQTVAQVTQMTDARIEQIRSMVVGSGDMTDAEFEKFKAETAKKSVETIYQSLHNKGYPETELRRLMGESLGIENYNPSAGIVMPYLREQAQINAELQLADAGMTQGVDPAVQPNADFMGADEYQKDRGADLALFELQRLAYEELQRDPSRFTSAPKGSAEREMLDLAREHMVYQGDKSLSREGRLAAAHEELSEKIGVSVDELLQTDRYKQEHIEQAKVDIPASYLEAKVRFEAGAVDSFTKVRALIYYRREAEIEMMFDEDREDIESKQATEIAERRLAVVEDRNERITDEDAAMAMEIPKPVVTINGVEVAATGDVAVTPAAANDDEREKIKELEAMGLSPAIAAATVREAGAVGSALASCGVTANEVAAAGSATHATAEEVAANVETEVAGGGEANPDEVAAGTVTAAEDPTKKLPAAIGAGPR